MGTIKMVEGSFKTASAVNEIVGPYFYKIINGAVQMDLGGKIVTAFVRKHESGMLEVFGFVGRYPTGTKNWRVNFVVQPDGQMSTWLGNDDRSGRCNKQRGITFDEKEYFKV